MKISQDLSWILEDLVANAPGARHAVLLSADGMRRGATSGMDADLADTISAGMSGLQSLSRATARFAGPTDSPQWQQTVIEFRHGWIFLIAAGNGAYLAVAAAPEVDIQDITFRMHQLVARLGRELVTPLREMAGEQ